MNHLIKLLYSSLFIIFIACESNNDNNDNDVIITTDINNSPLLLDLENNIYNETWDMKFSKANGGYYIELNSSAGVMSINVGSENFETASLPDSGLTYDDFAIGNNWVDSSTYNYNDHSINS